MGTVDNREFLYKEEYSSLREEINGIKKLQIWLIGVSVSTTGLLLKISGKDLPFPGTIACLFPLIFLLPSWYLFFDKAVSYHRIVGYLKVLEKIILNPDLARIDFPGWENALVIFRGRQQQKIIKQEKNNKCGTCLKDTPIYLQKGIRYLRIVHGVFYALSFLCIVLSFYTLINDPNYQNFKESALLFVIAFAATINSYWRNRQYLQFLSWGRYSYRVNEFLWKQILLNKMILEPSRLVEYGSKNPVEEADFKKVIKNKNKRAELLKKVEEAIKINKFDSFHEFVENNYKKKAEKIYEVFPPWRSKALNFEGYELDLSDYKKICITISTKKPLDVKVQLLNSLETEVINEEKGVAGPKKVTILKGHKIEFLLTEFKEVDLERIYRLAIHYGQTAFYGNPLNKNNDAVINIEEIVLEQ